MKIVVAEQPAREIIVTAEMLQWESQRKMYLSEKKSHAETFFSLEDVKVQAHHLSNQGFLSAELELNALRYFVQKLSVSKYFLPFENVELYELDSEDVLESFETSSGEKAAWILKKTRKRAFDVISEWMAEHTEWRMEGRLVSGAKGSFNIRASSVKGLFDVLELHGMVETEYTVEIVKAELDSEFLVITEYFSEDTWTISRRE